jgi:hypothetical protein
MNRANPTERSVEIRQQLHEAVETGHVLIPYHLADVTHVEPWPATTINYDPESNPIPELLEGRVIGTRAIDVAIFAAITGYMGPKPVAPQGSARIMQRVNRFNNAEISSLYSIAALSFAGKIALRDNETSEGSPTLVYWAKASKFEARPGLFPFVSAGAIAVQGGVEVSTRELSVDPYELPAVESIDWSAPQAVAFNAVTRKTGL